MEFELTADLIAALYEAALHPGGLTALTQFVARVLRVESAEIWLHDNGEIRDLRTAADTAESQKAYLDYDHRLDVRQSGEVQRTDTSGTNRVTVASEHLSGQDLRQNDAFHTMSRYSSSNASLGAAIGSSTSPAARLGNDRLGTHASLQDNQAPLQLLLPHLKNALRLRMRLKLSGQVMPQFDALETLTFGAIICDSQARVIFANSSAELLVLTRKCIGLRTKDRTLYAVLPPDNLKLEKLIHDASATAGSGSLVIADDQSRPALMALITPMPTRMSGTVGRGYAMVALRELNSQPTFDAARLIALFRLSPAQAALAIALYEGKSFEDIAVARRVKVTTLRTHFNELLNRTGAKGLRDLTRLLGMIPPVR